MLAGRLRTLALLVKRDDSKAVIPDRPFALRGALRAWIEADAGHIGARQHGLRRVNDCRLSRAVRADQGSHSSKVDLLDPEEIPVNQQYPAKLDHAAAPSSSRAFAEESWPFADLATNSSSDLRVSSATTIGSAGRRNRVNVRLSSWSPMRTSPRCLNDVRISWTRVTGGRVRRVRSS